MKQIYALGVGHNTPVLIDLAEACGYQVIGLYHYNNTRTNEIDHGFKILGSFEDLFAKGDLTGMQFVLTMGDSKIRAGLSQRIIELGGKVPTLIHPSAVISRFAKISPIGVYISAYTCIDPNVSVGQNSTLLSHTVISHNSSVGANSFIAAGVIIGAYTNIEDNVFIGQGALSISDKVRNIGKGAFIGARALITRNVPEYTIIVGSPGKIKGIDSTQDKN